MMVWFVQAALAAPIQQTLQGPVDQRLPLAEDGRLDLAVPCGRVVLVGVPSVGVHLTGRLELDADLEVRGNGALLRMEVEPRDPRRREQALCVNLQLEVPSGVRVHVEGLAVEVQAGALTGEVVVETTSGLVQLGPGAQRAELRTVSAAVRAVGVREVLEVETVSGSVAVYDGPPRVGVETVSGAVELQGVRLERVEAHSVSGSVGLRGELTSAGEARLGSHSGEVRVALTEGGARFDVQTFSGSLRLAGQQAASRAIGEGAALEFALGESDAEVEIRTFSGAVTVDALP